MISADTASLPTDPTVDGFSIVLSQLRPVTYRDACDLTLFIYFTYSQI